jgi:KAP family P-loop domain
MSITLVKDEIRKFLGRQDPEVLCIRGKWGVGKTYTWAKELEVAQRANAVKLPRYSYVSLFGVNSLDELKFAIFENVITLSEGVRKADLETLDAFVSKFGSWRKLTKIAQSLPVIRNIVGADATSLVSFMTIRDQVVCIDDLERRGQKLEVGDVLGLISYLREQRNCKVVLILNDEQLDEEAKRKFETNLEKVVDVSLVYEPLPSDSVKIGIPGTDEVWPAPGLDDT